MASANLIELIKILRERTGAGMMDCKKALEDNDLDLEKASDYLREKGIAKAAKKADRIAAEGITNIRTCTGCRKTIIYEINCETDFVSRSDNFIDFVEEAGKLLLHNEPKTMEEAKVLTDKLFVDATVKIGEKLDLRRYQIVHLVEGQAIGTYIHMGGKIGVVVILDKEDQELADNLAMHIAANNPLYVDKSAIPAEVKDKETAIQIELMKGDPKFANKPIEMLHKIVEGKVNKILFESVLSEQTYLLDESKTVGQVLLEKNVKIVEMIRYQMGEGIEKRQDDFASEVMNQVK